MLILPAEQPLDWKRPPLITLLLILLNTLIYLGYQSGDEQRVEDAVRSYLNGGLLARERSLFLDELTARHDLDDEARQELQGLRREDLAQSVLFDLQFEQRLHREGAFLADAAWQQARAASEALRDRISSIRFGFIPARFTVQGLFGAMFLHGSFDHLLGNMLFLFIVGFALEVALGRWVYLGLYLLSGLASHLLWWLFDPAWVAGIGASGAVSGLMGMYAGVFGLRRIKFFYWLGPLIGYLRAPALLVLLAWIGKELYGLLLADDNVNYYAHLGGLGFGFLAVWLTLRAGTLKVDRGYLDKTDPDAAFKRELAGLDQLIGGFALDQAASRGLDLLQRYPGRLALLERLYPLACSRADKPLLTLLLKQLFSLPDPASSRPLLQRLADDARQPQQALLQHPALQLHLLQQLLKVGEAQRAVPIWNRLAQRSESPAALPRLTLQLAKQLGQQGDRRDVAQLAAFLQQRFPDAEQTRQLGLYQQHLNG